MWRSSTAGPKITSTGCRRLQPNSCGASSGDRRSRQRPPDTAAKAATSTIPIVFIVGGDPWLGLVASLNRPGGNVTGVTILSGALTAKRLELLRELRPQASVACLVNPSSPEAEAQLTDIREAVHTTGKELLLLSISNDHDLDAAFATLIREQIGGLLLANDAFFVGRREQIVALAARHAIPTMYFLREFATVGGLMSYGSSLTDAYPGSASPREKSFEASNRPTYQSSRR